MNIEMDRIKIIASLVILATLLIVAASSADSAEDSAMKAGYKDAEGLACGQADRLDATETDRNQGR
jgi:hypothetical protein